MMLTVADPDQVQTDTRSHLRFVKDNVFRVSPNNQEALEHITALANEYQFEVFLANSPINDALYEDDQFQLYFGQVRQALQAYADTNERVHYVLQDPVTFTKEQMRNADHVTYAAAMVYSERLSAELGSYLASQEQ